MILDNNSPVVTTSRTNDFTELMVDCTGHWIAKYIPTQTRLTIRRVIYNDPATVVYWGDGTRTVVKCQPEDKFDPKLGFLLAVCKKAFGNTGNYNELLRKYIPEHSGEKIWIELSFEQMREELSDFCHKSTCGSCPMGKISFECGRGKFFTAPVDDKAYMTNESIVRHYRAMKGV